MKCRRIDIRQADELRVNHIIKTCAPSIIFIHRKGENGRKDTFLIKGIDDKKACRSRRELMCVCQFGDVTSSAIERGTDETPLSEARERTERRRTQPS